MKIRSISRRQFLATSSRLAVAAAIAPTACATSVPRPPARPMNIVFIYIDDMGWGDLSCYGNTDIETPNIDRLAAQGTRFTQAYVASPICSPSRVACTTGQFPSRYGVTGHFDWREKNRQRGMPDFLTTEAPAMARTLKAAGYRTAHFGKWHQGGGRDVDDAPHPSAYGFDEHLVCFEGLGPRALINNDGHSANSAKLEQGPITWHEKHELTELYVNRGIDFIRRDSQKPFYLQLWFNDVHDPHLPSDKMLAKHERFSDEPYVQKFYAVLDEMDRQVGRFLDALDQAGLAENTLVVLSADNGPTDWPHYYKENKGLPGKTGGLRGRKWSLYEGGIREPLIVRLPGVVPAGKVNTTSVCCTVDLLPTFCHFAKAKLPDATLDGENIADVFLGSDRRRTKPLFWDFGRSHLLIKPRCEGCISPPLAIRDGDYKLLSTPDGSRVELYNLIADPNETTDLAEAQPDRAADLKARLLNWYEQTVPQASKDAT